MKRVLILTPFFPPKIGGAESFALRLFVELKKHYDVDVCTIPWAKDHVWEGCNKWEGMKVLMRLAPKATFMCFKTSYDKVYALGLNAGFLLILLKDLFPIATRKISPTLTLLALYNLKKPPFLLRWMLNRMDKIFVEGGTGKSNAIKMGAKENKIVVYNHWADTAKYFPIHKEKDNKVTILYASRPLYIKGMWIIKEVERLYNEKRHEVNFVYATDIPHEDMPKLFQEADILVVPSIYEEGFPLTIAEGANCGCIVVSSNCGSLPEMVGPFGFVIEPTTQSFRAMFQVLLKDRHRMRQLRERTIEYARENFSAKNAEVFL